MFAEIALAVSTLTASGTGLYARSLWRRLHTDQLTGLPNRGGLYRAFARTQRRARRGELVGLLLCDVDRFKPINDIHGHRVGDHVLQTIAAELAALARPSHLPVRLHGDEFAILLPRLAEVRDAESTARYYRCRLARTRLAGGQRLEVSVSVGVAVDTATVTSLSELLTWADSRMYGEKRHRHLTTLPTRSTPRLRDQRRESA